MAVSAHDLKTARIRWKFSDTATEKQRTREREDLRFLVDHWPSDVRAARAGQAALNGMPPVPARPCVQVDKLSEPINRVLNQERASDIGIQLVPADDFAELGIELDETEIELREGLLRRIQRDTQAVDARSWAFKRAVQSGQGYYLVNTRFLPGKSWDKEVYIHRIFDQNSVRLDPAHEQPDGSDCNWEFIGSWMPWDVYKATYPTVARKQNTISAASESQFDEYARDQPDWVDLTNGARAVRVVDYWYAQLTPRVSVLLSDNTSAWEDELPDVLPDGLAIVDQRDVVDRTIHWCKLDGLNDFALEDTEWEGPDMPIVKVIGEEVQPFDGERRAQGMVRPARDSQFGLDAMISKQVESVALAPIPALHVDPVAIEGYEQWYALANTRTLPYLPSRTYDEGQRQLAPPTRLNAEPNLTPIAQSIALFSQGIQDTTATSDPALGRTDPSVKSARHAAQLIDQSNQGTSQFLDNLVRSMRYEGQIENNLLYPIYGRRPGRLVRILTGEGDPEPRRVNLQQTDEDANNQVVAQKKGMLTKDAKFNVAIKLTKNSTLKRDQESSFVGSLIESNPVFMTWFGDLFFRNQDGPGHEQMAERAKAMLDPKIQQLLADKDQGRDVPPEVQQKIAGLQEQLQHAEAAMQELAEEARGKKIESDTKLKIADLQAKVDTQKTMNELQRARMDNATKIAIAHINANAKGVSLDAHAEEEQLALGHEFLQNELDRQHERELAEQQMGHQVAMAGAHADMQVDEAAAGRAHEATLTQAQIDAQAEQAAQSEAGA